MLTPHDVHHGLTDHRSTRGCGLSLAAAHRAHPEALRARSSGAARAATRGSDRPSTPTRRRRRVYGLGDACAARGAAEAGGGAEVQGLWGRSPRPHDGGGASVNYSVPCLIHVDRFRRTPIPLHGTRIPLQRTGIPSQRMRIPLHGTSILAQRTSILVRRTRIPLQRTRIPLHGTSIPLQRTPIPLGVHAISLHGTSILVMYVDPCAKDAHS